MSTYSIKWCAIGCLYAVIGVGSYLAWQHEPIPKPTSLFLWEPYTEQSRDAYLEFGHNVLLFVNPELSIESAIALEHLDRWKIAKLFDYDEFVPLMVKHDWRSKEIHNLWREFGHTKRPFIVVYKPGEKPVYVNAFSYEPRATRAKTLWFRGERE